MEGQVRAFLSSLESDPVVSLSTRLAYSSDLRSFCRYLEKLLERPLFIADFTAQNAAGFIHAERQAGRRASTLLRRRASLRRFAGFLGENDPWWLANFTARADLIDDAAAAFSPRQKAPCLSEGQIAALGQVMEASTGPRARRDQAIFALLLQSGASVRTLTGLNLPDLDLAGKRLFFSSAGGSGFWLPLEDALGPLQRYLKQGRPELNYQPGETALFISQTGNRMSRQGVWQVLAQWGRKAGLPVVLSPRIARHTAAQRFSRAGRALPEIQARLGHSNPLSTQALLRRLEVENEVNPDQESGQRAAGS